MFNTSSLIWPTQDLNPDGLTPAPTRVVTSLDGIGVSNCTKLQIVLHCGDSEEGKSISSRGAGLGNQRGRLKEVEFEADNRARAWPMQECRW